MRTAKSTNGFEIIFWVNEEVQDDLDEVAAVVGEAGRRQADYLAGCGLNLVDVRVDYDFEGDHVVLAVELDDDYRHGDVLAAGHEVGRAVDRLVNTSPGRVALAADAADNGFGVVTYGGDVICLDRDLCPECDAFDWTAV